MGKSKRFEVKTGVQRECERGIHGNVSEKKRREEVDNFSLLREI